MQYAKKFIVAAFTWSAITCAVQPALAADPTLDTVRRRGALVCGASGEVPGFSARDDAGKWTGMDVDYCRGIAAAVLGDASKVRFVPLTADQRFAALASGEVDVLARNSTVSLPRTVGSKIRFTAVNYYDGQAFVIARGSEINQAAQLGGKTVCVTKGTTHEANLTAWSALFNITVTPVVLDTSGAMQEAFFAGKCVAATQDLTALAAAVVKAGKASLYRVLPDIISKEPLGPYVRAGDDAWLEIVRWTHYVMVEGEERNIRSETVDARRRVANDAPVRRLLGLVPGNGKALGLDEDWAYNILKQVGNYDQVYERNVGQDSPLKFTRGINALWNKGGLMYAPPLY